MNKYFKYFMYVIDHKKRYYKFAKKQGKLKALMHDVSKFSFAEFKPYAENFYGEKDCKKCKNYMNCDYNQIGLGSGDWAKECKDYRYKDFDKAWEHHLLQNKHHWNYWLYDVEGYYNSPFDLESNKLDTPKDIPDEYIFEMINDWKAMADKFGDTAQEFYLKNYNKIQLSMNTRIQLEWALGLNMSFECNYGHTIQQFVDMYDEKTFYQCVGHYIIDNYGMDMYKILKKK